MKRLLILLLFGFICFGFTETNAKPVNHVQKCWNNQVKPLQKQYLQFTYQEKANELEHNWEPWKESTYAFKGTIWVNAENFLKNDTLTTAKNPFISKTQLSKTNLLFQDYGEKELAAVTQAAFYASRSKLSATHQIY